MRHNLVLSSAVILSNSTSFNSPRTITTLGNSLNYFDTENLSNHKG